MAEVQASTIFDAHHHHRWWFTPQSL